LGWREHGELSAQASRSTLEAEDRVRNDAIKSFGCRKVDLKIVHGVNKWSLQVLADYSLKTSLKGGGKAQAASIASTSPSISENAT
jgi:hypothetical protein